MSPTIQVWWMAHLLMISGVLSYIRPGFPHFPLLEFCAYVSLLLPLFLDSKKGKEPTVGVVIPVLSGDADRLSQLLSDLYSQNTTPDQVVVSEGGLKTDLLGQCLGLGVFHISSVSGRGQQIFNGMMAVKTDVILVLHADSRISRDVIRDIKQIMRDQEIVGGCLTHEYRESGSWLRFTQWINWLRVHITGLSFGDQGQFFRRHLLFSHRVFEPAPLMEDVALSLKLSEAGKTFVLKGGLYSSSRQWKEGLVQKLGHARKIAVLVTTYLMRRRLGIKQPFSAYYRYYYSPVGKSRNSQGI
jgi:cellulose synthase/poly-beta-1,6-N-acetylglucosamine synthase-like glycosyltransferase